MNTLDLFLQMRSRVRAIAKHRRMYPAWGMAAALVVAALTLTGTTRAQEAKPDKSKDAPKRVEADSIEKKAPTPQSSDKKEKAGSGKFVSFRDGTLTLKGNHGVLVWNNITEQTKVLHWDNDAGAYKPAGLTEILGKAEAGTWVVVSDGMALIRVGARKGRTVGTFISFKNDRLLMLGKDLGASFTKKYGNQLHFNKFAEGVPVYESIDGGDYTLAGVAETILPKVKEGTVLTVYGEGDDNIVRIDLGVQKTKN